MFILLYNVNANSTPNTYYYYHYHYYYYYYYYYYYHYHYYCSSYHHYYCDPSVAWNGPALERPKTIGTGRSPEWSKRSSWERLNRLDTHRDGDIYIYIYMYICIRIIAAIDIQRAPGKYFCCDVHGRSSTAREREGQEWPEREGRKTQQGSRTHGDASAEEEGEGCRAASGRERGGRRKVFSIKSILPIPCIPVSTSKWGCKGALNNLCRICSAYGIIVSGRPASRR